MRQNCGSFGVWVIHVSTIQGFSWMSSYVSSIPNKVANTGQFFVNMKQKAGVGRTPQL